jgi:hypothetical protein
VSRRFTDGLGAQQAAIAVTSAMPQRVPRRSGRQPPTVVAEAAYRGQVSNGAGHLMPRCPLACPTDAGSATKRNLLLLRHYWHRVGGAAVSWFVWDFAVSGATCCCWGGEEAAQDTMRMVLHADSLCLAACSCLSLRGFCQRCPHISVSLPRVHTANPSFPLVAVLRQQAVPGGCVLQGGCAGCNCCLTASLGSPLASAGS